MREAKGTAVTYGASEWFWSFRLPNQKKKKNVASAVRRKFIIDLLKNP